MAKYTEPAEVKVETPVAPKPPEGSLICIHGNLLGSRIVKEYKIGDVVRKNDPYYKLASASRCFERVK